MAGFFIHLSFGFHYVPIINKRIEDFDPTYKRPKDITDYKH